MTELEIRDFWNTHPAGELVSGERYREGVEFFKNYDAFRRRTEPHIERCLNEIRWTGKNVLEIGVGQGTHAEQIIRRGGLWNGIDLTTTAVERTRMRLRLHGLVYGRLEEASALAIPFASESMDIVYSHGVLHHIPEILQAQREVARVLKPHGLLVVMLYAKWSLNTLTIFTLRRIALALAYASCQHYPGLVGQHIQNAKALGLANYLRWKHFIHRNTDGPDNPYSKLYSQNEIRVDFPDFEILRLHKHHMHAPPLPVLRLPGESLVGWHLWAELQKR